MNTYEIPFDNKNWILKGRFCLILLIRAYTHPHTRTMHNNIKWKVVQNVFVGFVAADNNKLSKNDANTEKAEIKKPEEDYCHYSSGLHAEYPRHYRP